MRLIDADKFEAFGSKIEDAEIGYTSGYVDGVTSVLEAIDAAPTIDAVPVVHSCWIDLGFYVFCGNCKNFCTRHKEWSYCPNCGAKMDGEGEDR